VSNHDDKVENAPKNTFHEEALKAREEWGKDDHDPFGDPKNIARSFPNRVDQSGTPDTQPHQPKEALGEGQLSIDSVKAESEEVSEQGRKNADRGERHSGVKKVTAAEQAKAEDKAKPNA
jgi:hypothetical protein